ncbi:MAG: pyridinium-3,5-bisthiocarboxylic acid mononucleotide nickel chelatase [Desulfobacteraceae bacterium Eth-SRB2]|nr:MAG: pyridinium-3,5-bisthiocarboxylic acid mononucleotide nickel chelatase [Desulfobacteraceae bacterium Eth-SRB2]
MIAYFDCFSGISGDMTLGAFIDLGVPVKWLKENLDRIPLAGFDVSVDTVVRNGITAKSVRVRVENDKTSRDYAQIRSLIKNSPLSRNVKQISRDIFERIADVEADIHGCSRDKVHFHEVGGIDAIVDIVGTALCINYLGIKKVVSSSIPLGKGFVTCAHGTLPVPAPATIEILKGAPVYGTKIPYELVTPTGAAIIVTLAESYGEMPDMIIEKTGYGAGKRDMESIPNLLRVMTGTDACRETGHRPAHYKDTIVVLETGIDDMNPEVFGFLMDRLFEEGALDVYWIPIFMKKNRPGTMVQVLCRRNRKDVLINCILSETSSLGVRYYDAKRCMLPRESAIMKTAYGEIQVKRIIEAGGGVRIVPEYEVCKKIALEKNLPIRMVYDTIIKSL